WRCRGRSGACVDGTGSGSSVAARTGARRAGPATALRRARRRSWSAERQASFRSGEDPMRAGTGRGAHGNGGKRKAAPAAGARWPACLIVITAVGVLTVAAARPLGAAGAPGVEVAWRALFAREASPPAPPDNPLSAAKIALGQRLFTDPRLSAAGRRSCASC